ncbi:MAG TPA: SoxR reducing system RseC family protein [Negativicutes bacterium]|jgi:sigma-E factor negative regulatory protein RseC
METQQEGVVLEVAGSMAKVKTSRHNDCENCGACPGNSAMVLETRNPLGARPGQRVIVEVQEVNMLRAAFIVYVLPLIAIFAGALSGNILAERLSYAPLWFQIGGGLVAFLASVMYIKYFDYNARSNVKMQPVITSILSK